MIVVKNQIFNLMDTNGRRSDVLNALKIYLEVLEDLKENYPTENWEKYPASISQFLFYEKALEKSKDVFRKHDNYDKFINQLGDSYQLFIERNNEWAGNNFHKVSRLLDESIENRSRHYTSTLVKIGFTDAGRQITEAGYSYLKGSVVRDDLEDILPLDNVNIALFRQLAKLKIFTSSKNGKRKYYSPFIMALVLLLDGKTVDLHTFEFIVQGLTPYSDEKIKEAIRTDSISVAELEETIRDINIVIPKKLYNKNDIEYEEFQSIFKSSKNTAEASKAYYDFFCALKRFRDSKTDETYADLIKCLEKGNESSLNKAFGCGKNIFAAGNSRNRYNLEKFIEENSNHPLLTAKDFIWEFYSAYFKSKWVDGIREYSDTTIRLLSATGLFKFENLPELSYKEILSLIFDADHLRESIFGEMSEEEYIQYEVSAKCYYGRSVSISNIFKFSCADVSNINKNIKKRLGVSNSENAKKLLQKQKSIEFIKHISDKYPKEKIMELLPLFSDRNKAKDDKIKKEVNDSAGVPTIYEYIIGIAWYYISNKEFDLYNSLNLTLNADFEPVIHAGGGDGDIVIHYEEIIIMLEVTLMNKQAQKRGEWEPVLRHSLNLKAASEPKETITFFIADELDYNTINIWRAVAAVPLESTNTHKPVDGVIITPFTNKEILKFLEKDIYYKDIVNAAKKSFAEVPQITNVKWQQDILDDIFA